MAKTKFDKTAALIRAALEPFRHEIYTYVHEQLTVMIAKIRLQLESNDGEFTKAFPYPTYGQKPGDYKRTQDKRNQASYYSTPDEARDLARNAKECEDRGYGRPGVHNYYRVIRPDIEAVIERKAQEQAEATIVGYVGKLAGKIGERANISPSKVSYAGLSLWQRSTLTVEFADGRKPQVWDTKMILNCSPLGTLFNQFPTTLRK